MAMEQIFSYNFSFLGPSNRSVAAISSRNNAPHRVAQLFPAPLLDEYNELAIKTDGG
jgi:hypothetical protein